ncbi:MAG: polymorphic toxin type 28 domain-containing protein [bacterium]
MLTPRGARAIASLKTGDTVTAYDSQTGNASTQTVEATTIHHDDNLVDVTLQVTAPTSATTAAPAGKTSAQAASAPTTHTEVVHTTANHPWLSADHGWLIASFLHVGEPVQQANGSVATVVAVRGVPGAADMWDLTVSNLHDFAVGTGAYVVHNCGDQVKAAADSMNNAVRDHLKPSDLEGAWRDAHGDPVPRPGGGYYNHLREVLDARNSLVDSAEVFKSALNDSRTAAEDIPRLQSMLSYASRTADRVESIISADRWMPGTYIAPFR